MLGGGISQRLRLPTLSTGKKPSEIVGAPAHVLRTGLGVADGVSAKGVSRRSVYGNCR